MKKFILLVDPSGETSEEDVVRAVERGDTSVILGRLQDLTILEWDESGMIARKMDPKIWEEVMEHVREVQRLTGLASDGVKVDP